MTITQDMTTTTPGAWDGATVHWTGADPADRWLATARGLGPVLAAAAEARDRDGAFVHDGFELLKAEGLMGMMVPTELGGGGARHRDVAAVLAELAHGCPATSLAFSMHQHLVAAQVWRHQRGLPAPVLGRVAAEQLVLISTGASDWLGSNGRAERVDGGYRVSAHKAPASGCPAGDVLVTSFRLDDGADGPQVLHASVPFSAPGVRIEETWDTMGMRATGSHTVVLDDVFVPEAAVSLARPADVWHPVWSTVLGVAMPLIMASYVGVAEAASERTLVLAGRRGDRPDTAPLVGRMLNRLTAAQDAVRAMLDATDELSFDNTLGHAARTLSRRSNAAEAAIDTVRLALELGGGEAYGRASGIERLFRDVHGALYHPLPLAAQERFSGSVALGLDPVRG